MKLFKRKEETSLVAKENPIVVSVPDIKEYLVREYERVNLLIAKNEELEVELNKTKELQMKYDALLVTLDEYSKRLEVSELKVETQKADNRKIYEAFKKAQDEINSYKIKFNEAAITKEKIANEIVLEFKNSLVEELNKVKGNLSKMLVAKIINETKINSTEKGGAE